MTHPCKDCERKGCGAYHDQCEPYLKWVEEQKKAKQRTMPPGREYLSKATFRSRRNRVFHCSKR